MEQKKRKPINSDLIILACIAVVVLFFAVFSSARSTYFAGGTGECLSISVFGKMELKNIDKAVVTVDGATWTVTDADFLDQIVTETKIATRADLCSDPTRRIDLYCGDECVRSMEWAECCDTVKVYEPDLTHWLFDGMG